MTSQFISIQVFSRKPDSGNRTVGWILDEADRVPGTFSHIENPLEAVLVYGCSINDLRDEHERRVSEARVFIRTGHSRAIGKDQNTLAAIVISHPYLVSEVHDDAEKMKKYLAWEDAAIGWLLDAYGAALKSVVRHVDESHMHIHAFLIAENLKATDLHPGFAAKKNAYAAALNRGVGRFAANKASDQAYTDAMRAWQDAFHAAVRLHHGHERSGPLRPRLTRGQWYAQKMQAKIPDVHGANSIVNEAR